ncbi:MAG: copper resistance D family protein, partial [Actinomycetota bacterium]
LRVSFTLVRFAAFAANALIFGSIPLLMLVLRPAFKSLEAESWRAGRTNLAVRLEGLIRASLVASAVATVLALLLQTSLVSLLDEGDLGLDALETVLETSFGIWNLIRLPVLSALSVLLFKRVQEVCLSGMAASEKKPSAAWWGLWGLLSLTLLATWSLSGHAAVSSPVWAAVMNDVIHLAAGSTWFAGIVVLAVTLPDVWQNKERPDRLRILSEVVSRFSRVALISIIVLAITGTLNSFFNLESPRDLIDSGYGITLTIKIGLFLCIVALGAINHFYIRRRLQKAATGISSSDPYTLFRKTIATELVLGLLLMGSTGLLVGLARTKDTGPQSAPAVSSGIEWGPGRSA